jgi:hypothetical protein
MNGVNMRKLMTMASLLALLLTAPAAFANHYADFYVIPVVSSGPGANGSNWTSDIAIFNFQPFLLNVNITFIRSGEGNPNNVEPVDNEVVRAAIAPNSNVLIQDVVRNLGGRATNIGAIMIGANRPFAVTSRSINRGSPVGTFWQTVPPARDFLENALGDTDNAGATAYIPGLMNSATHRTNLGFVAATANNGAGMTVSVSVQNDTGSSVGTRSFFIPAGSLTHVQFPSSTVSNINFAIGSATFRITQGDGSVVPYGSVVDNATGDGIFITGQFPPNAAFAKTWRDSAFREFFERSLYR